jgi:hypothetical protein
MYHANKTEVYINIRSSDHHPAARYARAVSRGIYPTTAVPSLPTGTGPAYIQLNITCSVNCERMAANIMGIVSTCSVT